LVPRPKKYDRATEGPSRAGVPPTLGNREIIRTKTFATEAANFILQRAREAVDTRGEFRVALSGGNTPRAVYSEMAKRDVPWEKFQFAFSDERCVPPENEKSNFRMANEALFRPASVPESSILRMCGEIDPMQGADEYQGRLDTLAAKRDEKIYQHDLVLLGLGDDGHTASLFPNTEALLETERRVAANYVPKMDSWRLTFTFPLIFAARAVCFLIGANKDPKLIERVLSGDLALPAAHVVQNAKQVTWIIEQKS
jgi:6-phosphogluconolactonase